MIHLTKQPGKDDKFWYGCQSTFTPGITACNAYTPIEKRIVPASVRDRVGAWFIRPLENFRGEDAFACLMMIHPLTEKFLRYKLKEGDETKKLEFSKRGKLCRELGKFLAIPEDDAFEFWRSFRNGLLHRATIDAGLPYALHPEPNAEKPVAIVDGVIHVYVWALRNQVVKMLKHADNAMWTKDRFPILEIYYND